MGAETEAGLRAGTGVTRSPEWHPDGGRIVAFFW